MIKRKVLCMALTCIMALGTATTAFSTEKADDSSGIITPFK